MTLWTMLKVLPLVSSYPFSTNTHCNQPSTKRSFPSTSLLSRAQIQVSSWNVHYCLPPYTPPQCWINTFLSPCVGPIPSSPPNSNSLPQSLILPTKVHMAALCSTSPHHRPLSRIVFTRQQRSPSTLPAHPKPGTVPIVVLHTPFKAHASITLSSAFQPLSQNIKLSWIEARGKILSTHDQQWKWSPHFHFSELTFHISNICPTKFVYIFIYNNNWTLNTAWYFFYLFLKIFKFLW